MFAKILCLWLFLGSFIGATLSAALPYATWSLAIFQFRCKAPNIVESRSEQWKEWRVSSICVPGTCCATRAATGPLCTAEACEKAEEEREQKLKSYKAVQASQKKAEAAREAMKSKSGSSEAERKGRLSDSLAEAERQKALAKINLSA